MKRVIEHPVLDRRDGKTVKFIFDGKEMEGFENEMVSTALFANGVQKFSIHPKDDQPQGIFCANGQCSQCTVIIDGQPLKSCVTPLKEGMNIKTLYHIPELPEDGEPLGEIRTINMDCDVLVIGGGPAGLTSTIELAKLGFNIILIDDKDLLGGKLVLQTHKFFGSEEDSYAGTRGYDIGIKLEEEVRSYPNVKVLTETSIVGMFKDKKVGAFIDNKNYALITFEGVVVSGGAREKSLIFPGNELPGVYGAGAFQTLVNRDLIKASEKVFVVGSGNVGLIGAYHALQAGITPVGICEISGKVGGYKVHSDKIIRMGVPLYMNTTILSVEGDGKVEKVTIAKVDDNWNPILETAQTFEVDTVLIAAGLTPVDEFYQEAEKFGFKVIKAGDADEIAEASSAMFGGKIAGMKMANLLGKNIEIDPSFYDKAEVLKSHPGEVFEKEIVELTNEPTPIFHCVQEIPCNPCTTVCPKNAIDLKPVQNSIMDIPHQVAECISCNMCVAVCPGLAISLVKVVDEQYCEVTLPHEFNIDFKVGDTLPLVAREGEFLEDGEVLKVRYNKKYRTNLVTFKVTKKNSKDIAGVRILSEDDVKPLENASYTYIPENGIVCRCERVSVKEIVEFIKDYRVRDVNQLKQVRVGMGACGSKTCSALLPRIFSMAGVDWKEVKAGKIRPLTVEIPMGVLINENK